MKTIERINSSFRDPAGFLFWSEGVLFRQVNQIYQPNFQRLHESGLYDHLVKEEMLVSHKVVDILPPAPDIAAAVLQPEFLPFISYPYEWSFGALKDAALLTLNTQKIALDYGLSLKDSSVYNVQFNLRTGKPIQIDTLSFEIYQEGMPWIAYQQFCKHFLAPLALMAYTDVRLSQLLRVYIDGIPLDLSSTLLPKKTRINFGLFTHIHAHSAAQRRYAGRNVDYQKSSQRRMSKQNLLGIIDNLERVIVGLNWEPAGTEWVNYTCNHNYSDEAIDYKKHILEDYISRIKPNNVWDLGANTGVFSRQVSQKGIPTIAFDIDPAAVEINYRELKKGNEINLLPLVMDLTNPSSSIGWHNNERISFTKRGPAGAVLALALIHHLAISNNVPLDKTAEFFADLTSWLIIEFVSKADSQVKRLLASREDIFPTYTQEGFEAAYKRYFIIKDQKTIKGSERIIYLMERRTK